MLKIIPHWWTSEMPSSSRITNKIIMKGIYLHVTLLYPWKYPETLSQGFRQTLFPHSLHMPKAVYMIYIIWEHRFPRANKAKLIFWGWESQGREPNLVFRAMNPSITMVRIKESWDNHYKNIKPWKQCIINLVQEKWRKMTYNFLGNS